jgi:hypothetical protein
MKFPRRYLLLFYLPVICLFLASGPAFSQEGRFWRWAKRTAVRFTGDSLAPEKPRFLIYPTLAYSPETSLELGFSSLLLYHAKRDVRNRLSEVSAFTFITFKGQYGLWFDHALYGNQDKWFFLGRLRFQQFPLLYFGIGPNTTEENPAVVDASYILVRERVLHKIANNFFGGVEFDFQRLGGVNFRQPAENPHVLPRGSEGSANFGIGTGLVYDNRHNVLNVRKGFFSELAYLNYNRRWGSAFNFQNINFDTRYYHPFGKQVLALQMTGSFVSGDAPFNQLALVGGETIMRGYYLGRYRDKSYVAAQAEYRWLPFPFSKRFGGVAFAAVGTVAPSPREFQFRNLLPTGGVGLRYLLFASKDIFLRFDVGLTPEGPGFYIFTGEAF